MEEDSDLAMTQRRQRWEFRQSIAHRNKETLLMVHRKGLAVQKHPLVFMMDCSDPFGRSMGEAAAGDIQGLMEQAAGGVRLGAIPAVVKCMPYETMHSVTVATFPHMTEELSRPPEPNECFVVVVAIGSADLAVLPVEEGADAD